MASTRDNLHLAPVAWGPRSYTGLQVLDALWRVLDPTAAATAEATTPTITAQATSVTAGGAATSEAASTITVTTAP